MNDQIDQIENDFLEGRIEYLKNRFAPSGGRLFFSIAPTEILQGKPPGRRIRCGITIYDLGENEMISHMTGYCPAWAEGIEDWKAFSEGLYSG